MPEKPTRGPARPLAGSAPKRKRERGDVGIAALGIALGLTCALFPWYIFFNQDKFGVQALRFQGSGRVSVSRDVAFRPRQVGEPMNPAEIPTLDLDFLPTGTLPRAGEPVRPSPAAMQPFPADLVAYKLVHVANGRAMIEDEDGLWVVQRGSRLPDASHVASIERRQGRWVLVTTGDRVLEVEK